MIAPQAGAVARAVDTHVHIVDPARYPVPEGPGYKPAPDDVGTAATLVDLLAGHRIRHAVIVQLSGYGHDNTCVLEACAASNGAWRAIVSLAPDTGDRELDRLSAAGAVGVRFNVANHGLAALAGHARLLDAMRERGWIAQLQCPLGRLAEVLPLVRPDRQIWIVDHLGLPDATRGTDQPGFDALLDLGRAAAFLKLSGAFRISREPFPHGDLDPLVAPLLGAFPRGRRIWGSDWPFVGTPSRPRYGETLDMLARWLPDEEDRRDALAVTPARLFGFGED